MLSQFNIAVAPMMGYTDRHFRYLARLLSPNIKLYTEMLSTAAVLSNNNKNFLALNNTKGPLVLQLGGSDPKDLAACVKKANLYSYQEINLNIGCPSNKVQNANIGACLMAKPKLVGQCIAAMQQETDKVISIKTRIGIDKLDDYKFLQNFIIITTQFGCNDYTIHARKAWLNGLSPKQNRTIPEINYPRVYKLKQDFPNINININGEIKNILNINQHLQYTDGIMIGRAIYNNIYLLSEIEKLYFNQDYTLPDRKSIIEKYLNYCQQQLKLGVSKSLLLKPLHSLYYQQANAKQFRKNLANLI